MAFQMIFMDAGQGDSTLIVHPDNSLVLVDCGSLKNKDVVKTQIYKVINRYLPNAGNRIKSLVLTHPDSDHYNLVKELLDAGAIVDNVFYGGLAGHYSAEIFEWIQNHMNAWGYTQSHCSVEVVPELSYDPKGTNNTRVDVRVLSANAGDPEVKKDANPNSIVLMVTYATLNFFLMGDATSFTENFILSNLGKELDDLLDGQHNVLKPGHHGSHNSSSEAWLKKLKPQVCFISSDTQTFHGVSIPRSSVIKDIKRFGDLHDWGNDFEHKYVQYDIDTERHEEKSTTLALYSTLHRLHFTTTTKFVAYGTTWYYDVSDKNVITIGPACGWEDVNKAF